jgi:hypothetical protein
MGYKLSDMVSEFGLTMTEFRKLDSETQEKWRALHRQKHKERQEYGHQIVKSFQTGKDLPIAENLDERHREHDSFVSFLESRGVDYYTFQWLNDGQKRFFEKQYQKHRQQTKHIEFLLKEKYSFSMFIDNLGITTDEFCSMPKEKQQKIISMHIGWALEKEKREKINNKQKKKNKKNCFYNDTPDTYLFYTGNSEYDYWMEELASMGVPMGIDGPLGVGWDA